MAICNHVGLLLLVLLLAGCATSNVQSRRNERLSSYEALDPEVRMLVDQGKIRTGMSEDAVYIAWGQPDQILQSEDEAGPKTVWIYQGTYMEEHRYWRARPYRHGRRIYWTSYPDYDYYPRSYIGGEVVFENGAVKSWRTMPRPH